LAVDDGVEVLQPVVEGSLITVLASGVNPFIVVVIEIQGNHVLGIQRPNEVPHYCSILSIYL
jgi:hypothetical protein